MKKVAVFFPFEMGMRPFSGGVFKATVVLIKALVEYNYHVTLVLPKNNSGIEEYMSKHFPKVKLELINFEVPRRYKDASVIWRFPLTLRSLVRFMLSYRRVAKFLKKADFDVVYFQEIINWPFFKTAKSFSKRTILHVHTYRFGESKVLKSIIERICSKYVDAIISPTRSIAQIFEGIQDKVNIIPTPYMNSNSEDRPNEIHYKGENGRLVFGFVGRINRVKRIDNFLEVLWRLESQSKNKVKFLIIGDANNRGDLDYKRELYNMVRKMKLEHIVEFTGYVQDIEDVLTWIDVGVLLSRSEAISMAGLEFIFHNIPIIAYDVPGLNELIADGEGGVLVQDGNIKELTKVVERIVNDADYLEKLKKSCDIRKEIFSFENFSKKIKKVVC